MLTTCDLNISCTCGVPVSVPGPLLYGSLLYVLLLDGDHDMYVFLVQVMRSAQQIMLLQFFCVQLCCAAAVFRDNVCLATTHNHPALIQYTTVPYAKHSKNWFRNELDYSTHGHFAYSRQPIRANRSGPPISD